MKGFMCQEQTEEEAAAAAEEEDREEASTAPSTASRHRTMAFRAVRYGHLARTTRSMQATHSTSENSNHLASVQ
jgi:hypothetical protein